MNIVFDLGGVLVAWEPETLIRETSTDPEVQARVRSEIFAHNDWLELDRGTLPLQEAIVRGATRTGLPESEIANLLNRVPESLVPIPGTIDLLNRVKEKGHMLFCLSNMHVASIEHLEKTLTFWPAFEGAVISCRVHRIKPEPEIYAHLLDTYQLHGNKTLFIDDTQVNLDAAEKFSIQTIRFRNPDQCEQQLKALGCL